MAWKQGTSRKRTDQRCISHSVVHYMEQTVNSAQKCTNSIIFTPCHTYIALQLTIILLLARNMDFTNDENSILVYLPADLAILYHLHN